MIHPARVPAGLDALGGELAIGGRRASAWAAELDTPCFLYDRALIERRIAELRAALPPQVRLHYAVKANPLPELIAWIAPRVDGLDVASGGELATALAAGGDAGHISFAGPGKRDAELGAAITAGATLNVESAGEFDRALAIAVAQGRTLRAALRINPDFELKGSGMRMGGGAKPFGVDADQAPLLLPRFAHPAVDFRGFQIFAGSQNLSAASLIEAQRQTIALAARMAEHAPAPPVVLNLGGGFGIPYFPTDSALDLAAVGRALAESWATRPPALAATEPVIELGRYLVGEAGVYLTRVIDRKWSAGELFLVADGGLHHQLAASGNFGTVVRRNYPLANASRFTEPAAETATVVGCLCTPLDRLGERVALPQTQPGDLIAVFMAGAYGRSASPTAFLGHPLPAERLT
ncbi:MAG: pyridoxal-dependent decarboxylase, exosortase A system-associated [Sphingomonadaceae bacterium]|nr:pyridoxal-dependent decarboxylase, exosortase A system-associated [Sphingomonadaceae bacterium]